MLPVLKQLFAQEKEALLHFFDTLDLAAVEQLFNLLKDCQGLIVVSGVGKSGLVAEKIALTMTSTGTRAFYLAPSNAMHGDIGIVTSKDVFIMISKSGESEELLQMIPTLRNKGVKLIAVSSNPSSRLVKACEHSLCLPLEKELCPYDLAPTTSTVIQMIFGDVLAIALMLSKQFSLADFAANHPAGRIGRRLTMKVQDLMLRGKDIPLCHPDDKLVNTLVELSNKRCGCVMVVDKKNTLLGIFTDGDLRRALQNHGPKALDADMQAIMTKKPRFVGPEELAAKALSLMESDQKNPITVLPVIDSKDIVVGLIKMHDIVQSGL